jgi:hypothetical protein
MSPWAIAPLRTPELMDDPALAAADHLHALDALPLATHGARLRDLAPPVSTAVVRGWLDLDQPELRGVVQSFSLFCGMAYFSHPEIAPRIAALSTCGFGR